MANKKCSLGHFSKQHHSRGARQVGKTTLVRMLASQLGLQLVEINLEKPWHLTETFASLDPRRTIEAIELEFNLDLDPDRALIFFDEAQACPSVLPLLRYFHEETPQYRVITTGSLLGFVLAQPAFSMPVGRLEIYDLGPLTFEEFLSGIGEEKALNLITGFTWDRQISATAHQKVNALVRTFCLVGGMPEGVGVFADSRSLRSVSKTKTQILETYRLDFNKYFGKSDPALLQIVFDALPRLLGHKLIYTRISRDFKSGALSAAVRQLELAGLLTRVHHSDANGVPLAAEKRERISKPVLLDAGLLLSQLKLLPTELDQEEELNLINKGALAKQFIGQHLLALQPRYRKPELFYWCREKPSSSAEVDYLLELAGRVVPVEVKAGKSGKLRSLQVMIKERELPLAVRFWASAAWIEQQVRDTALGTARFKLISLPHYLVEQTPRLVADVADRQPV